ncbi:30S ribosome-binding factor RbfA [Prochlorococcus sp. MIT 1307]|uniref:30S ribosome-binding factor RbfA n=1 Tax=Prochlorococcus sp. MIT 1307 TaxID=3096219 RepID=UPI002A7506E3|nr:30S ribosome-binding factor RbfA [Prochlorococcus sp. MIT 1307]
MTHGRRVERVAALIRREISQLLINGIRDERVHLGMVTITKVEVSGDLQHCKIFVSIYGEESQKNLVMTGLNDASGFLRGELGRNLQLRRAPEIVFYLDQGIEKGTSVLNLLERLKKERNGRKEVVSDQSLES